MLANHLAAKEKEGQDQEDEDAGWNDWELEDDDSGSEGGWKDVSDDGDDIYFSDSDDEGKGKKRRKIEKIEEEEEEVPAIERVVVEVAATVRDDGSKVEVEAEAGELMYEMSLTRANKELAGTKYANLATTKVSSAQLLINP